VGGEPAAFVTYSVMYEQTAPAATTASSYPTEFGETYYQSQSQAVSIDLRREMGPSDESPPSSPAAHHEYAFPILTDEERRSPLGMCLSRVLGLFQPMSLMLLQERGKNQALSALLGGDDDLTVD
jgi:hypothetical protein